MDGTENPLGATPPAALLFAAAGLALLFGYWPERDRADELDRKVETARARLEDLRVRERRLAERATALEWGEPETLAEVIREQLRKGRPGEYVAEAFAVDPPTPPARRRAGP